MCPVSLYSLFILGKDKLYIYNMNTCFRSTQMSGELALCNNPPLKILKFYTSPEVMRLNVSRDIILMVGVWLIVDVG